MNRIFCVIGKSGAGKDTLYKEILSRATSDLIPIIPYTTRPKRVNETDGLNYFFVGEDQMNIFERNHQIMEKRQYSTVQGIWSYFTLKFELEDNKDYILITTLEGLHNIIEQYGSKIVHVVYLYIDDKERLIRCINRESQQATPDYLEVCRRFIADQEDFSEEHMKQFEHIHYINTGEELEKCLVQWNKIYERKCE